MSESGQGRPDSFASTLKVQRSAVGSGSGRHETARPMSQLGREAPFKPCVAAATLVLPTPPCRPPKRNSRGCSRGFGSLSRHILRHGSRQGPVTAGAVLDLTRRLRQRGSGTTGRAAVSVKWRG
jgi:hypothetical protein